MTIKDNMTLCTNVPVTTGQKVLTFVDGSIARILHHILQRELKTNCASKKKKLLLID